MTINYSMPLIEKEQAYPYLKLFATQSLRLRSINSIPTAIFDWMAARGYVKGTANAPEPTEAGMAEAFRIDRDSKKKPGKSTARNRGNGR